MHIFSYIFANMTLWERAEYEIRDLVKSLGEFFIMIKEVTYDVLAKFIDPTILNMGLISIGALLIMLVCLKIINR